MMTAWRKTFVRWPQCKDQTPNRARSAHRTYSCCSPATHFRCRRKRRPAMVAAVAGSHRHRHPGLSLMRARAARALRRRATSEFNRAGGAVGWHTGDNPAKLVRLPEMVRRESHALSFDQSFSALASLQSPAREMVLFAILTCMNIAEICGLQWKRVNLNEQFTTVDGESLPPLTIAVRAQWYRGEYGSVKAKSRRRNLPIPVALRGVLAKIKERTKFTGPD